MTSIGHGTWTPPSWHQAKSLVQQIQERSELGRGGRGKSESPKQAMEDDIFTEICAAGFCWAKLSYNFKGRS